MKKLIRFAVAASAASTLAFAVSATSRGCRQLRAGAVRPAVARLAGFVPRRYCDPGIGTGLGDATASMTEAARG